MSNLSDRGTLRGTLSVGSESGGTDDYNDLNNKPSINSHELVGNQSGDDLGLINSDDLNFNVGHAGGILHNIKYKNNTYTTYAEPFRGATTDSNGTMGLVRAPLASQGDYNKFLKGNGTWAAIGGINYSTEEQDTGIKWIDGKPIYQKTIILKENGVNKYTYVNEVYQKCLPQFEYIKVDQIFVKRGDSTYIDVSSAAYEFYFTPNSNQDLYFNNTHNPTDIIMTIQYTKSTT